MKQTEECGFRVSLAGGKRHYSNGRTTTPSADTNHSTTSATKTRALVAVISLLLALGADTVRSATTTWINSSGGNWSDTNNWSAYKVPGVTDTAVITIAGNYNVSLDVSPTVAGLVLGASSGGTTQSLSTGSSTLAVNGPIQVNSQGQFNLNGGGLAGTNVLTGTLTWSGGNMAGNVTVASNSVLNIVAGGGNGFSGLVLTNYGTVNWTNTTLYGRDNKNAQIYNYGLWNAQSDNIFEGGYNNGTTLFDNFGTFLKSGNTGATLLDSSVVFNDTGAVVVERGTLDISGGTSSGGLFTTATGAILSFVGTAYNFTNDNTFTGIGSFVAAGATFSGTILGTLGWDGGALSGVLSLPTNSVLNIVAGGGDGFNGLVLTNYGTVNWTNTALYGLNNKNAQIYNYGLWNAQSDNIFEGGYNGGTTLFDNFGTFIKAGNTNVSTLDSGVVFNNTGTVNVESGTLDIGGGTSSGGNFITASGAILSFVSTAYNFTNSTTFTGRGGYLAAGATFSGIIAGTLGWDGGILNGVMTLASNSVFNIAFGSGSGEFNGLVLTNYGTVNWTNTTLYGMNKKNAQIYNYGVWNAQSDNTFQGGYNGGTTLFDNFGRFLKSGNAGATVLDGSVVFNNTGIVSVGSGTLNLEGGGINSGSGTFATAKGGLLGLDNMTFANSATISGSTIVELGGDMTIIGVLTAANLELVSGTLGGTNVLIGTLTWSGGNLSGALTLASNSVLNIVAGGGNGFSGLILTNYGTVNWTNTTLYGRDDQNAQIYNYGLWNAQSDNIFEGGYDGGTTLFDNFGKFLKSGATGATVLDGSVVFNNTGTVNASSGTLNLNGGGTSSGGDFATADGGIVNFSSYLFTNSNTFTGQGSFVAAGATFAGSIAGTLNWDGGSLAGAMTLASNSVLNIVAGGGDGFKGLVFTNYGTVNWTNTTLYGLNNTNAQIYNYGLWNAQGDNIFEGGYNGGTTLFDNFGTFIKAGNTNVSTLDSGVVFNNTGTVNVESGTLDIGGGTSSGGNFITASGAILSFVSTAYNFTNSTTFAGMGGYLAAGATFSGIIAGTLGWDGGNLAGVMTLASNSVFNIAFGSGSGEFNGLVLTNYGTVNWTNTSLYGMNKKNAQIYNYGLWNAQSDNIFEGGYNGGTTLFDNFGTFLKSGNAGATVLDGSVVFNNAGILDAESGNIRLQGTYDLANGTLTFGINSLSNYGTIYLGGAAALAGSVNLNFNNGFFPALGSQFNLLSGASLTGTLNSAPLPFGLSLVYSKTGVTLVWSGLTQTGWATGATDLHGTISTLFWNSAGTTLRLVATANGVSYVLGSTAASGLGAISFDTTQLPNGVYTLQAIVLNAAGQVAGDFSRTIFVNNSLAWHEGMLSVNETWGTNAVNAVDQTVIIPNGVTLTIEAGTIVKFAKGAGILIEPGGVLSALGTTNNLVIFTSMADDSVGGDSNLDGNNSVPEPGDWTGVTVQGTGQFNGAAFVDVRYAIHLHGGTLAASETWAGGLLHIVNSTVVVPTNVVPHPQPGRGAQVCLQRRDDHSNGRVAQRSGNRRPAHHLHFTRRRLGGWGHQWRRQPDNTRGGRLGGLNISGRAVMDHCNVTYGGNTGSGVRASGVIIVYGSLGFSNGVVANALWDGISVDVGGSCTVVSSVLRGLDRAVWGYGGGYIHLVNCTFDENVIGICNHVATERILAENCVVANSIQASENEGTVTNRYCDLWSKHSGSVNPSGIGQNGNISADPKFKDPSNYDYRLDYGSPGIDAADGTVAPPTDLMGSPRYTDPRSAHTGIPTARGAYADMGAYEFVESASSDIDLAGSTVSGPQALPPGTRSR